MKGKKKSNLPLSLRPVQWPDRRESLGPLACVGGFYIASVLHAPVCMCRCSQSRARCIRSRTWLFLFYGYGRPARVGLDTRARVPGPQQKGVWPTRQPCCGIRRETPLQRTSPTCGRINSSSSGSNLVLAYVTHENLAELLNLGPATVGHDRSRYRRHILPTRTSNEIRTVWLPSSPLYHARAAPPWLQGWNAPLASP